MLKLVVDFMGSLFRWLTGLLPNSPFQEFISNFDIASDALSWLNWFVPIGNFVTIFLGYLAVLLLWMAVNGLLDGTLDRLKGIIGGATEVVGG